LGQQVHLDKLELGFSSNVTDGDYVHLKRALGMVEMGAQQKYLGLPLSLGNLKKAIF